MEALGQEGTLDRHINTRALESRRGSGTQRMHACMGPLACPSGLSSDQIRWPLGPPTRTRLPRVYVTVAHHHARRPLRLSCSLGTAVGRCFSFSMFHLVFSFFLGRSLFRSARAVLVLPTIAKNYYVTRRTRSLSIGSVW